jgi:glycosyltransferase involved in cell wall biosynthesis
MGKNKKDKIKYPLVTICTPTFNRRPFIPSMIKCFEIQNYPKDKIEWIIIDDGTDKIGDLVTHIPQVKYLGYEEKMTLGKKRNIGNQNAKGDIIIYMDDDDYYPPDRISHAVETLNKNPKALCAGSSAMFIYFKHINKMYRFGPYSPTHATAATFAFRKELLNKTSFNEKSSVAEEKHFLKDYTIPFVQLDPKKSILVFSHSHNSFDKKELLQTLPSPFITEVDVTPADIVKETEILHFFMDEIDLILDAYEPGKVENKPDVAKQLAEIKLNREKMIRAEMEKDAQYKDTMMKLQNLQNPQNLQHKINDMTQVIQQLSQENSQLKEKLKYLEDKIKSIITEKIQKKNSENNV